MSDLGTKVTATLKVYARHTEEGFKGSIGFKVDTRRSDIASVVGSVLSRSVYFLFTEEGNQLKVDYESGSVQEDQANFLALADCDTSRMPRKGAKEETILKALISYVQEAWHTQAIDGDDVRNVALSGSFVHIDTQAKKTGLYRKASHPGFHDYIKPDLLVFRAEPKPPNAAGKPIASYVTTHVQL